MELFLETPRQKSLAVLVSILVLVIVGWALRATSVVAMPLVAAAFVAVLLRPIELAVRRRVPHRQRWLGVLAAMLTFVMTLALIFGAIFLIGKAIAAAAPRYKERFTAYQQSAQTWAAQHGIEINSELLTSEQSTAQIASLVTGGLVSVWSILGTLVLVFFLVLLLLIETDNWRSKIEKATPPNAQYKILATLDTAAVKVRDYMWSTTLISIGSAITEGTVLWLAGVDLALVWAFLIFLANYVPNLGSIVTLSGATLMAFVQLGWAWGLVIGLALLVIDQMIGNFLTPRIQGERFGLSSLLILISTIFWGWLWGVAGAVLATPIMLTILVFCAHTQSMRWLAVLLSDDGNIDSLLCEESGTCPAPQTVQGGPKGSS